MFIEVSRNFSGTNIQIGTRSKINNPLWNDTQQYYAVENHLMLIFKKSGGSLSFQVLWKSLPGAINTKIPAHLKNNNNDNNLVAPYWVF